MTPRQARVALTGFFFLAAGVTANALYLQGAVDNRPANKPAAGPARAEPQRQPAAAKTPKAGKPAERTPAEPAPAAPAKTTQQDTHALKVRMVRVATIGEAASAEADADTVRAVQTELNRRGYGPLTADGAMGHVVRAAIMAFEQDHRLPLTGEASQELLKQIVFGTPAAGAPGAPEVRSPHAQAVVKEVQRQLADRGYRPGVDGRLSAETIAAIRAFEADQGLAPKGRISAVLVERLQSGIGAGGRHPAQ